jgi:hypothetical protein
VHVSFSALAAGARYSSYHILPGFAPKSSLAERLQEVNSGDPMDVRVILWSGDRLME